MAESTGTRRWHQSRQVLSDVLETAERHMAVYGRYVARIHAELELHVSEPAGA
ncbi:hypothetical protein LVY72_19900 [Arthrobacter sp. I2-34]|uniref:Uncharacterized protein n=1 Tax=Arthrobacter hankyongi TaxID=2904801 RepID=A0ABS9LBW0_9MICC|nr:hypothetical protein [Arthrobacter hankyongi]MCG2624155.1 hypothetical protein [Arthrobacter hankyongi]